MKRKKIAECCCFVNGTKELSRLHPKAVPPDFTKKHRETPRPLQGAFKAFLTDRDKKIFPFLTINDCLAIYNFFFNISLRRQLIYILWQMSLKKALLFVNIAFPTTRTGFNAPQSRQKKIRYPIMSNRCSANQLIIDKKER